MLPSRPSHSNRDAAELTIPLGLYVHIPFCVHRCSYCDFYSFTEYGEGDFGGLARALIRDIREARAWWDRRMDRPPRATSVFFGGGTPSLMPVALVSELLEALDRSFPLGEGAEITLEANPETVTEAFARELRRTAVNRVSLGAQSFQGKHLRTLERLGSPETTRTAARHLREAGWDRFSLDLIFGIPGQDTGEVEADIRSAAELGPEHLSFYSLTLAPGHRLAAGMADPDTAAGLYERGVEVLEALGYERYEISNFARPGRESRHNLLYWSGGDFLGFGPSAASRVFRAGVFLHRKQRPDLRYYLREPARWEFERSSRYQTALEAAFLELRKCQGVSLSGFRQRYGWDLDRAARFPEFVQGGFLSQTGDTLRLTPQGLLLADYLSRELVDESPFSPSTSGVSA